MNKPFSHLFEHRLRRRKGDTAKLAAQLAPPEEQRRSAKAHSPSNHGGAVQEHGAIVVDNNNLNLEEIEDVKHGKTILGMEPIVLAILIGMLLFIAFIAWQISQMPE